MQMHRIDTGFDPEKIYEWANQHLPTMRELARYVHKTCGRGMVQFIIVTKPEIKGTVTVQSHAELKKELDPKSQISAMLLDLLKSYAPEHDFVAGIMCDGAIVSLHLISLTGSLGFNDPKAKKIGIPKTDPSGSKN